MSQLSLRWLNLKRFRSIPAEVIHFENPTILVGRNGSGKSNLVDAFPLLAEAMEEPLASVLDRRGGIQTVRNRPAHRGRPPHMGVAVGMTGPDGDPSHARYAFELKARKGYGFEVVREQCVIRLADGARHWFDRRGERFEASVESLKPAPKSEALALPLIGGDSRFDPVYRFLRDMRRYQIEPARLRELQDPDPGLRLRSDGGNAASVLHRMRTEDPARLRRLVKLLETVAPTTYAISAKKHGNRVGLQFRQRWSEGRRVPFEAFSMSDGTLRVVGLLLAVLQTPAPSLLVIEEPEATIHPGAVGTILDVLLLATDFTSVVITTHSPDILDAKWVAPEHLRLLEWASGITRVAQVSDGAAEAIREHLMGAGELLRANSLTPAPLFERSVEQPNLFEPAGP